MATTIPIEPGMTAAVVGFGRSGQAMARFLAGCGARLLISDMRPRAALGADEEALLKKWGAEYEGGGHTERFLGRAATIVVSPGVSLEHPALIRAQQAGCALAGELALAAGRFQAPVVAITGTNGKTTVTELVGALLAASGRRVFVGGNIGTPIGDYLTSPDGYEAVVLEVSSFQLDLCGTFTPDVALLLNITPDHLDRHGSLERYAAAKMKLFGGAATELAVMNGDDPLSRRFRHLAGRDDIALFGSRPENAAWVRDQRVMLTAAGPEAVYDLAGSRLATLSGCLNSAAALLAVQPFSLDRDTALQTLRAYRPGDHRVQFIAAIGGVAYVNDSKATNTGAVQTGLQQVGGRVVLIAGGRDKGDDYRLLRDAVGRQVKRLVLIGEAAPAIAAALADLAPVDYAADMESAVRAAAAAAAPGDTVLLSPACASFDMFRSYAHRGECFIAAVAVLEAESGRQEEAS